MTKFKINDKVRVKEEYLKYHATFNNTIGTVMCFNFLEKSVGVDWHKDIGGHSLKGMIKSTKRSGWFMLSTDLEKITTEWDE